MKKTIACIFLILCFILLLVYSCSEKDEVDFDIVSQNYDMYEAVKKIAPDKNAFMNDVPSKGWTALVINCNEKEFNECFKALNRFEIKGKLEVQVLSPTRSFIKTKDKSIIRP